MEEQRTNTALYSSNIGNAYWSGTSSKTANFGISPDGTQNAARITGGGYFQSGSISKTGTQTFSFWAKTISGNSENIDVYLDGGFTTTSKTITGSWVRYSVTQTFGSADTGTIGIYPLSANILFYGPQLESGAFSTSYIPTTSASATRSADVCQITGSDFSSFWNASEGSVAVEFSRPIDGSASGDSMIYIFPDSSDPANSQIGAYITSGKNTAYGYGSSAFQYNFDHGTQLANTTYKIATGVKLNDFASSQNGGAVLTDTSGSVPGSISRLLIGYLSWSTGARLNGHIARLRYFNKRLPNADLRYLTGGSRGFQPDNINGLQLWLDASDSSTLFQSSGGSAASADGDPVGYWADKSGNGRNAIQSSGTNKPSVRLNVLNTKPVIRFDGVNDFLGNSMQFANSAFTIIAITKRAGGTNYPSFVCEYSGTTNAYFAFGLDPSSYLSIHKTGLATSASNLVQTAGTFFIQSAQSSGISSGNISVDVKSNGVDASSSLTLTGLLTNSATMFGASKNGTADYFNGDFAEIIIYNSVISGSDLDLVNNYLNQKWSVY
jgi:hypothetical protein